MVDKPVYKMFQPRRDDKGGAALILFKNRARGLHQFFPLILGMGISAWLLTGDLFLFFLLLLSSGLNVADQLASQIRCPLQGIIPQVGIPLGHLGAFVGQEFLQGVHIDFTRRCQHGGSRAAGSGSG